MPEESIFATLAKKAGGIFGEYGAEKITGVMDYFLWQGSKQVNALEWLLKPLAKLEDASTSEVMGFSPLGVKKTLEAFVDAITVLAPVLGKEIVDELIGEMVQEGISNSIQTSLGGALQTIFNVRRGSFPNFQDAIRTYSNYIDKYDRKTLGFISAGVGLNIPNTAMELAQAGNDNVYNTINTQIEQVINLTTFVNNYTVGHITNFITACNVVYTRLITLPLEVSMFYAEIVRRMCEEHLARVNELEDALENIYRYYTSGIVNDEDLIITEMKKVEAELIATEIVFNEYYDALVEQYDRVISNIENALEDLQNKIERALGVLYTKLIELINEFNDDGFRNVLIEIVRDKVKEVFYTVAGYREINPRGYGSYRTHFEYNIE